MDKKTVCIVGMGPAGKDLLPCEPSDVEMWGLNLGHLGWVDIDKYSAWFQLHPLSAITSYYYEHEAHLEFLRTFGKPVYLHDEPDESIPTGIRYPYEDVCKTIGSNYFATNTLPYMVALAIHQGFERIKVYGVGMGEQDIGDSYARPSMEFVLGLAVGKGIEVWVPDDSPLLKGNLYARTVMIPSTGVDMAINVMRRTLERMPLGGARTRLHSVAEVLENLRNEAVDGTARHGKESGIDARNRFLARNSFSSGGDDLIPVGETENE